MKAATLKTELAQRMIERADADSLPEDHAMRLLAIKFDEAATGYYADPQTVAAQPFLGAWSRARKQWCDYTRERLV